MKTMTTIASSLAILAMLAPVKAALTTATATYSFPGYTNDDPAVATSVYYRVATCSDPDAHDTCGQYAADKFCALKSAGQADSFSVSKMSLSSCFISGQTPS